MSAGDAFTLGAAVFGGLGVLAGRWSVFLLLPEQRRQRAHLGRDRQVTRPCPHVQVEHAGQYVQQLRSERAWRVQQGTSGELRERATLAYRLDAGRPPRAR